VNIIDTEFDVIDIETTGLDPAIHRVVEIAAVPCSLTEGVLVLGTRGSLVDPLVPIPAAASAIHHLVDHDVIGEPTLELAVFQLDLLRSSLLPVAHNARFDSAFLPEIKRPFLCTMRLAQKLWPDLESYGNQFLRYHLKLDIPAEIKLLPMHRAFPDAVVTACLLLRELTEVLARATTDEQRTVEYLMQWVAEPILLSRCKFGKHKGMLWQDVPRSYLAWMLSPGGMTDMDDDLRFTVEHYSGN